MKVLRIIESMEKCAEAGWDAYDFQLDAAIGESFIYYLSQIGDLVYLKKLNKPFFKIENNGLFVKGIQGESYIRVAFERKRKEWLEKAKIFIEEYKPKD